MSDRRSRRAVLASLGTAAATALAGCNSTSTNNNTDKTANTGTATPQTTQANSGDVIKTVKTTTTQTTTAFGNSKNITALQVSVTDASIDAVALRNSDGKEVTRKQLGTGTTTQFPLADRAADTYDILAVKDESVVGELSKTLKRKFSIEGVEFVTDEAANTDKRGYVDVKTTITNTGDLPVTIPIYYVFDDVPSPAETERAPIGDEIDDDKPTVPPGKSQALTTRTDPLAGRNRSGICSGDRRNGTIELKTDAGQTTTISFEYSLSGDRLSSVSGYSCTESMIHSWETTSGN